MEELKFSSKEEALQHLADISGARILVAKPLKYVLDQLSQRHNIPQEKILELATADPKNEGNPDKTSGNIETIIGYYKDDKNVDLKKVGEFLKKFNKMKGSGDIDQRQKVPKKFKNLEKAVSGKSDELVLHSKDKFADLEEIGRSGQYRVFKIDEKDEWGDACVFVKHASGHPWCVKQQSHFNHFKPLWLFTKGNDFYALLSEKGGEFEDDEDIEMVEEFLEIEDIESEEFGQFHNMENEPIEPDEFAPIASLVKSAGLIDKVTYSDAIPNIYDLLDGDFEEAESGEINWKSIANHPSRAFKILVRLLDKGDKIPEELNAIIAKSPGKSLDYARLQLQDKKPVPAVIEEAVLKSSVKTQDYVKLMVEKNAEPTPLFNKMAANSSWIAVNYAKALIENGKTPPDPIVDAIVLKKKGHARDAYQFLSLLIKHDMPVPEKLISVISGAAKPSLDYAKYLQKKGQEVPKVVLDGIASDEKVLREYVKEIVESGNVGSPDFEEAIIGDKESYYVNNNVEYYIKSLLKNNLPISEKMRGEILRNNGLIYYYAEHLIKNNKEIPKNIIKGLSRQEYHAGTIVRLFLNAGLEVPEEIINRISRLTDKEDNQARFYILNAALEYFHKGKEIPEDLIEGVSRTTQTSEELADMFLRKNMKIPDKIVEHLSTTSPFTAMKFVKNLMKSGLPVPEAAVKTIMSEDEKKKEYEELLEKKKEKAASLKFSSTDEALQYLADYTRCRIAVPLDVSQALMEIQKGDLKDIPSSEIVKTKEQEAKVSKLDASLKALEEIVRDSKNADEFLFKSKKLGLGLYHPIDINRKLFSGIEGKKQFYEIMKVDGIPGILKSLTI